jgi:hypothetical protein
LGDEPLGRPVRPFSRGRAGRILENGLFHAVDAGGAEGAVGRIGVYDPRLNEITAAIIHSALNLHTRLGPGLFESVYERILARDLGLLGLTVERQVTIRSSTRGCGSRRDFAPIC